jgi:Tol biopolymer transport system component
VSRLAFARGEQIFVADADGRHARFLVRGNAPQLSPDGRWVAFYGSNSDALSLVAADGGRPRRLGSGVLEAWSRDSRRLALATDALEQRLVTMDRASGARHTIAVADRFLGVDFSPDGRRIVFALGRGINDQSDLYVSGAEGGAVRRLTWDDRSGSPVWAPDGWIDFAHREGPLGPFPVRTRSGAIAALEAWGKHRIWRIRADGRGRHVLTRRLAPAIPDQRIGIKPFARRGRTLLAAAPLAHGEIPYLVDASGRVRSVVTRWRGALHVVGFSRDGRYVLLWDEVDGPDSARTLVELMPVGGGRPRVLLRNVGAPSWSR